MTPKEQYEARKAERKARRDAAGPGRHIDRDDEMHDLMSWIAS